MPIGSGSLAPPNGAVGRGPGLPAASVLSMPQRPMFSPWASASWGRGALPGTEAIPPTNLPPFSSPYCTPRSVAPSGWEFHAVAPPSAVPNQTSSAATEPVGPTLTSSSPATTNSTATLRRQQFDPLQVQLRQDNGRWLLVVGNEVLKSFAHRDTDAMFALNVIRFYRLTERWTLGEGDAAIEFWFSFGQPPRGRIPGQQTIPISPDKLHVRPIGQDYWVTDGTYRYFRFRRLQDAEQAVHIIRQFRFTQVGVIGRPQPIMIYFLADP
ncbi:hypothetical protein HRbin36_00543 [bacterium HR36]|nr:hypothetical protein HRbin36_00543 [bacterium HR36]